VTKKRRAQSAKNKKARKKEPNSAAALQADTAAGVETGI
jgi:hypothetical protein